MRGPTTSEPTAMVLALRALAPPPSHARWELVECWKAAHAAGALDGALLADGALLMLQSLTVEPSHADGDASQAVAARPLADDLGSLDMVAADLLRHHGEARHLEPLRALRPRLRPRSGLRDWRLEVGRAIATIEARTQGRCVCTVDAAHGAPLVASGCEVLDETVDAEAYEILYGARCTRCGRRWRVTERHGYHYPTFDWLAADGG